MTAALSDSSRRVTALMAVAIALVSANGLVGLVHAQAPHRAAAAAIVVVQLAAAVTVTALLNREAIRRPRGALSVYALSLAAVFGSRLTGGLVGWVAHRCDGVGASPLDLASRFLEGTAAVFIVAAVLATQRTSKPASQSFLRRQGLAVVSVVSFVAMLVTQVVSDLYINSRFGAEPWCVAATSEALAPGPAIAVSALAGYEEEFAFTGVALALFSRNRIRIQIGALGINIVARSTMHLYYADTNNVERWALWAALWSGGILALGFLAARIAARKAGSGTPMGALVWSATAGTVVAHSFWDLNLTDQGKPFAALVFSVAGVVATAVLAVPIPVRPHRTIARGRQAHSDEI